MIPFIVCLVILLVVVVELVRRRRLREEFSWLWIGACVALIALVAATPLRSWFAALWPADGSIELVMLVVCLFLVALSLDFSIQVSSQSTRIKNLAQEVSLLRKTVEELQAGDGQR